MSVYLTSSNGSLTITQSFLTNLPKCNEVPTQSNQLVNKAYVDSFGLVINQINLNDYINSLNLATGDMNVDLSSNTMNYLTNNIDDTFISLSSGTTSNVLALAFDLSGNLYAGGTFTTAGGVSVNRIARWNGTSWSALGGGFTSGSVNALTFDLSGNLYAGGTFTTATNSGVLITVNRIARWNDLNWSTLGSGLNATVNALAVDLSGNLYAGGDFTTAGVVSASRIARRTGISWSALGGGMNATVRALAVDLSGNLYAGGDFTDASGVSVNRIARWNGTSWSALGGGFTSGSVNALTFDLSGNLYAGGTFTTATNSGVPITVNRIARWNGLNWSALGGGMNATVNALAVDLSGNLYAGGDFTTAGVVSASRIAKWNGTTWSALGSGMSAAGFTPTVTALEFDLYRNLYAGGNFSTAGGVSANRIAKFVSGPYSIYVNNKYLYNLSNSQTINVNITNQGVAYTNGLVI